MKNVAIVGLGNISDIYIKNIMNIKELNLIGVYDIAQEKVVEKCEKYEIGKGYDSIEDLLGDAEIDIVVNLTTPVTHYSINKKIINANKSVYCEKPLTITYKEAIELRDLALEKGVMLAAAPDTFLGVTFQEQISKFKENNYGECIGGFISLSACPEAWHPNPDFYYQAGGGPVLDVAPYFLGVLIELFGRVVSVNSVAKKTKLQRNYVNAHSNVKEVIDVKVPTHTSGVIEFEGGQVINYILSFDIKGQDEMASIKLFCENGVLNLINPVCFSGECNFATNDDITTLDTKGFESENSRGIGILHALSDAEYAANKAVHMMEVMEKMNTSTYALVESEL